MNLSAVILIGLYFLGGIFAWAWTGEPLGRSPAGRAAMVVLLPLWPVALALAAVIAVVAMWDWWRMARDEDEPRGADPVLHDHQLRDVWQ